MSTPIPPLQKAPVPEKAPARPWPVEFYSSAMGKKYVMAITGIIGLGFILFHALGNLHVFEGAARFSEYGEGLRDIGEPLVPRTFLLWIGRLGLIGALAFHVHAAYTLTLLNRKKRPVAYQAPREYIAADYASRTMVYTGTVLLAFIFFHLADLTWGWTLGEEYVRGAVTNNFVGSLSRIPVALFYVVAMLALGMHIYHGTWSLFQTLGLSSKRFNPWRRHLAIGLTVVIVSINLTFPLGTMFGVIDCGDECHEVTEEFQGD